jgi:predicted Zn-dependent peptidase
MKPHKKVLKNGLRIVTVPMKSNPTVTVLVLVEAGSHYEEKRINGLSHFLEHMCFKGTSNRPSPTAISHELDALGAESNAFTSHEYTGYYAKARTKNFAKILDVVADLYLHPTIPQQEIEKEKGVIIEEMRMYEDIPMRSVGDLLDKVMYGEQPAGRKIVGTESNIRAMERNDFVEYRERHYVPEATAVIVAGDIEPQKIYKAVESYFASVPKHPKPSKPKVKDTQRAIAGEASFKESSQTHFQLGFRSVPIGDKRTYAIDVLQAVLGAGMSSRLFRKLREEMGVCYYVRASSENNLDHGKFIISSGVDTARLPTVLSVISEELIALKKELVSKEELEKAKEVLVSRVVMGLESSDELATYYGMLEILHRPLELPEHYAQKIRTVTAAQVRAAARMLFKTESANLALIGPYKSATPFKKLIRL